jgi:2-C-methyl-D-erythritol 4-phosphate cytidylyltransferase
MQSDVPKQFLPLAGKPIIFHSIEVFTSLYPEIQVIIALPEDYFSYWNDLCEKYSFKIKHQLSKGGERRFHTVKNALALVPDDNLVAIHDAVRPLVSKKTVEEGFRNVLAFGNAIPAIPVNDSYRWTDGNASQPVDRDNLRIIQTPQVFQASIIKRAYQRVNDPAFTDDASVAEAMGEIIRLYEGNRENIKITHPDERAVAEALIRIVRQEG